MAENSGRLSQCIDKSLAQLKNKDEILYYPINESDLHRWEHCPLCESTETQRICEVYLNKDMLFFSTDICKKCMHIFRGISPNTKWFVDRWHQIATGELQVYNPPLEEKRKIRYEMYYGILHKFKSKGVLLDVGAAYGSGTNVFLERGFDAIALEPEQDRAAYIRSVLDIPVYESTIEDFESSSQFDLILFSHCLEHLSDPLGALKKLKSILADEGVLYIEIPMAWKVIDWQDALFMAHKHNFLEKNFKKIVELVGYKIIDSYLIPDNDAPFCNLALIAVKSNHPHYEHVELINKEMNLIDPQNYDINDLINLYKIQMPINVNNSSVLKYSVPYINHFYHIIRDNRRNFRIDGEYISYLE